MAVQYWISVNDDVKTSLNTKYLFTGLRNTLSSGPFGMKPRKKNQEL